MRLTKRYCVHCSDQTLATRETPTHGFHLLMTCLTLGLWSLVWGTIILLKMGQYRCGRCGERV
jgi:hypothetical protein